jgi:hypothetical protein
LLLLAGSAAAEQVTVYRCKDANGRVSLQDEPCAEGQTQEARQMQRPVDAAPAATPAPRPPVPEPVPAAMPVPLQLPPPPPPPMYVCTSYDGKERESEVYDPNPRCEPVVLLWPHRNLPPEMRRSCHWIQDSCVRLSDSQACARFKDKQLRARSDLLHAFSDTAAYRKSELERLTQIVDESCR